MAIRYGAPSSRPSRRRRTWCTIPHKKQGKQIRLLLEGEGTKIGRNRVGKLYDHLVHMVCNSVDYGIEPPAERLAAMKLKNGTMTLAVYHKSGAVCIEICYDGKGLTSDNIMQKALKRGLIDSHEGLKV